MNDQSLTRTARRDLLIAAAAILALAGLFGTVLLRPPMLTDATVRASRAMNPLAALVLAVAAGGLAGIAWGKRSAATAAGWLVILLAAAAFLRSTLNVSLWSGGPFGGGPHYAGALAYVPTTTTLCLCLIGAAVVVGAVPRCWRAHGAVLGILGMSVVALALLGGLTDLLHFGPPYQLGRGAPMSPVTALALIVAGAGVTVAAWRSSTGSPAGRGPAWLPAVAGLATACGTLMLWWAAAGQEHASIARRVDTASRMMASDLRSRLALLAAPVNDLTLRGNAGPGAASAAWRADAAALTAGPRPPFAAIGWVPGRAVPHVAWWRGDSLAIRAGLARLAEYHAWDPMPGGSVAVFRRPIVVRGDTDLVLFGRAAAGGVGGPGAIAVLRVSRLLADAFGGGPALAFDFRLDLDSAVVGEGRRGSGPGTPALAQAVPVDSAAPSWRLTVWPAASETAALSSPIDEIVLATGLTLAALLTLLARLWQQARARALEVEIAHRNLAADVVRHGQLEAQLRQSQKMEAVGQLTGGIAHDLNNVLTVVVANAELMAGTIPPEAAELKAELAQLHVAASRGAAMVRQLLAFSRHKPLTPGPVDLVRVVDESSDLLRRLVPEHIVVRVTHEAPALTVMGDAGALEQVLVNLVTNARDAMPQGGTLRLETRRVTLSGDRAAACGVAEPGAFGCLVIADTGVGMDAATRERAFEPFFTTKEPGAGTGLGLAMVYALVQQLGGCVRLSSELGRGTEVTVYLPATAPRAAAAPAPPPAPAAPTGRETILVVEDEIGIRRATRRVLERHGYRVLLAENGEEGLEVYRRNAADVDLVLSDVVMPRLGGPGLYRALRGEGSRVPFLFASGYASPQPDDAASLAGVPTIAKPWTIPELLTKVREVLDGEVMG